MLLQIPKHFVAKTTSLGRLRYYVLKALKASKIQYPDKTRFKTIITHITRQLLYLYNH